MFLTNYTTDKVKLAFMYVEMLRSNWGNLDDKRKQQLLKQISELTNVDFITQEYESKLWRSSY
jgi:hypothetical protein